MTSLFADIAGSTGLGECLRPAEVKAVIGDCVSRMSRVVEEHGGRVTAFMGDGIAAFFGLEAADERDMERALLAARDVVMVAQDYGREIELAWNIVGFNVRIGVNAGKVATGLVGASEPQYVALGDVVNVAARLQGMASPGQILVGASVAERLGERFEFMSLGEVVLRGREERVEAWELVGEKDVRRVGVNLPMVGRADVMERLVQALDGLLQGRGGIIGVMGEAGLGKSRLIAEVRKIAEKDVRWLESRCTARDIQLPYGPLVGVLQNWCELDSEMPEVVARMRVLSKLRELFQGEDEEVLIFLAGLLGIYLDPESENRLKALAPAALAVRYRKAYAAWLGRLADAQPTVLAIDDLERADSATCELLEFIFGMTDSSQLLVVFAMRPEPEMPGWKTRIRALSDFAHRMTEVQLVPLEEEAAEKLVFALDGRQLGPAIRKAVVERAEGNPLYMEELYRSLCDQVGVESASLDEGDLPPALEGLLVARIDRLPRNVRRVLQVAAVCGRRFGRTTLERAVGVGDVEQELAVLLRRDIIRESKQSGEIEYVFKHGLVQDAVLSMLPPQRLRYLHRKVGEALEMQFGGRSDLMVDTLATHFLASDQEVRALPFLEKAAERSATLESCERSLELMLCAKELAEGSGDVEGGKRIRKGMAELLHRTGQFGRAAEMYLLEANGAIGREERAELLVSAARALVEGGDFGRAAEILFETTRVTESQVIIAETMVLRAKVAFRTNDYSETRRLLGEVESCADDTQNLLVAFERTSLWCGYWAEMGDGVKASEYGQESLGIARKLQDPVRMLKAKRDLGLLAVIGGRLDEALALLTEVYDSAAEFGHETLSLESGSNLLWVYVVLGQLSSGREFGERLLEAVEVPYWKVAVLTNLGTIEFERGALDGARMYLEEASLLAENIPMGRRNRIEAEMRLAAVVMGLGYAEEAEARLMECLREAEELGGRFDLQVLGRAWLAEAALRQGEPERAVKEAEAALGAADRAEKADAVAPLRLLGSAREQVEPGTGREEIERALALAREIGMRLEEGRALVALAGLDDPEAGRWMREAVEIFEACGAKRDLADIGRVLT